MSRLENKVAIITGGASGIGLATVHAFLDKGAKVVIGDINEEEGEKVVNDLKEKNNDISFVKVDVSDEESVANLVSSTVELYGKLNIILNNAGFSLQKSTLDLTNEEYQKVVSVNQDGVFYGMKHAIPEMKKAGGGSIVNTGSILGVVGEPTFMPAQLPYEASKGAINQMTKSVALEFANYNIRANTVAPGFVESKLVNKEALGDAYDKLAGRHPIGRLGKPEEIAHAVIFLCENDFVTGTTIMVDGGYTAQ